MNWNTFLLTSFYTLIILNLLMPQKYPMLSDFSCDTISFAMDLHCDLLDDGCPRGVDLDADVDLRISKIVENDGKSKSTMNKMMWSERVFNRWRSEHFHNVDQVEITHLSTVEILKLVPRFILEVRKEDKSNYPPNTLFDLIIYLQQRINFVKKINHNWLEDASFKQIKLVLDDELKRLRQCGFGCTKKQSNVIEKKTEEDMWISNILGDDSPHKLLHTMIFALGINLALRGRMEHRKLQWDNFEIKETLIRYKEHTSKCNSGGIKGRKRQGKVVEMYENAVNPSRCPVRLFKKYASLCPVNRNPDSSFYFTPLKKPSAKQWYSLIPVGVNTISAATKNLLAQIDVEGFYTNHSLRRSAITRLYEAGVDEKRICETSGHRSDAVRDYQITNQKMRQEVSQIIQGTTNLLTKTTDKECESGASTSGINVIRPELGESGVIVSQLSEKTTGGHQISSSFNGSFSNCNFHFH